MTVSGDGVLRLNTSNTILPSLCFVMLCLFATLRRKAPKTSEIVKYAIQPALILPPKRAEMVAEMNAGVLRVYCVHSYSKSPYGSMDHVGPVFKIEDSC
ncbi:hypothetical protein ABW21_db0202363 [Orbilia brochopaga]|nr:hypothetical protein ABW21_db0202363 [Drechslerella brochopaga]